MSLCLLHQVRDASLLSWSSSELPLLRPRVADVAMLRSVTLVVAVFDKDRVGTDDLMGVVLVPLAPPPTPPMPPTTSPQAAAGILHAGSSDGRFPPWRRPADANEEYTIDVNQPLVLGNATCIMTDKATLTDVGHIRLSLTVYGGSAVGRALVAARDEGAGSQARALSEHNPLAFLARCALM